MNIHEGKGYEKNFIFQESLKSMDGIKVFIVCCSCSSGLKVIKPQAINHYAFILSLRMNSSFITSRPVFTPEAKWSV